MSASLSLLVSNYYTLGFEEENTEPRARTHEKNSTMFPFDVSSHPFSSNIEIHVPSSFIALRRDGGLFWPGTGVCLFPGFTPSASFGVCLYVSLLFLATTRVYSF